MAAALELVYTSFTNGLHIHAEKCLALTVASGWSHYNLAKWVMLLEGCSQLFVAQRSDGSFVGCLVRSSFPVLGIDRPTGFQMSEPQGFDFFGMMLVDSACRGQGIAKKLLELFETQAQTLGHCCGLGVATADGLPVYAKRGYHAAAIESTVFKVAAPAAAAAALACEKVDVTVALDPESRAAALMSLVELDRIVTGLDRSKALAAVNSNGDGLVAMVVIDGQVVAALLGTKDSQTGAMNLGPILGQESLVKALIRAVGEALPESHLSMMVLDHKAWIEDLKAVGFACPGSMTGTMILGDARLPGDRSRYIAIINPCFG